MKKSLSCKISISSYTWVYESILYTNIYYVKHAFGQRSVVGI